MECVLPCVHALNTTVQTDKSFLTLLKKCKYGYRVVHVYATFLISATCNFNKVPFITTCSAFTFHSRFTRTFHHHHRHHLVHVVIPNTSQILGLPPVVSLVQICSTRSQGRRTTIGSTINAKIKTMAIPVYNKLTHHIFHGPHGQTTRN